MKSITELKDIKPKLKDFDKLPLEVRKKAIEDIEHAYTEYTERVRLWKANQNANK